ncbi:NeuD/PglB/VioB family sugar acetyltransferase [uncultured Limimaricola sp.]|uniref:NeuD/PglB/VioB family sugar acetyltransferase n=1 Tax=uncultured Limimaricola sp. TaxID=2211667 RepID=UPI0030FB388D
MIETHKPVVLFGLGSMSQRLRYYLDVVMDRRVVAVTVDREHATVQDFEGLPVVPFDRVQEFFPPETHAMFVCVGYADRNIGRARVFAAAREMGYELPAAIDPRAIRNNAAIGDGSWIAEGVMLGVFSRIGCGCLINPGTAIAHHTAVGDFCYLAGNVTIAGDCRIGERTMLGAGAIVRDGVEIAPGSLIGAGAVVLRSIETSGIYTGNPARLIKSPS